MLLPAPQFTRFYISITKVLVSKAKEGDAPLLQRQWIQVALAPLTYEGSETGYFTLPSEYLINTGLITKS
jgi:hypothetical protein